MRLARLSTLHGPRFVRASPHGWEELRSLDRPHEPTGVRYDADLPLLAPADPRVVLGALRNSPGAPRSTPVAAFLKSPRTVTGPDSEIIVPAGLDSVLVEGELAAIIGRPAHRLSMDQVADAVAGWTLANDVTAVDELGPDPTLLRAKGGSGFTPLGPWLTTDIDPRDVSIRVAINGVEVARGDTGEMTRDPLELVADVSALVELGPGDVVLTGAPNTTVSARAGDRVTISAAGLADLSSYVIRLT